MRDDRSPEGRGVNAYGVEVRVMEKLFAIEEWKTVACPACGRSHDYIGAVLIACPCGEKLWMSGK